MVPWTSPGINPEHRGRNKLWAMPGMAHPLPSPLEFQSRRDGFKVCPEKLALHCLFCFRPWWERNFWSLGVLHCHQARCSCFLCLCHLSAHPPFFLCDCQPVPPSWGLIVFGLQRANHFWIGDSRHSTCFACGWLGFYPQHHRGVPQALPGMTSKQSQE